MIAVFGPESSFAPSGLQDPPPTTLPCFRLVRDRQTIVGQDGPISRLNMTVVSAQTATLAAPTRASSTRVNDVNLSK